MNKALSKRLDRVEWALMSPLDREIAELLLQLYGTLDPDPAVLTILMAEEGASA
jgi:hypothetical protein